MDCSASQARAAAFFCDRERRGDFGALGAVTHDFGAGASAGREQQRIDQDRFAGAGLAGEHGQARAELQLDGVDDREVADLNMQQHGERQSCG